MLHTLSHGSIFQNFKLLICSLTILATAFLSLLFPALTQTEAKVQSSTTSQRREKPRGDDTLIVPITILFKWSGLIGPGGARGGCNTPLGICITRGIKLADGALSKEEISEGVGIALAKVKGDRLDLVFTREAALRDGTIRLTQDYKLEADVAHRLGYESITLISGTYKVDMSTRPFGETSIRIRKGEVSTTGTAKVTCYMYQNTTGFGSGCGVACDDGTNYPMSCTADIFQK